MSAAGPAPVHDHVRHASAGHQPGHPRVGQAAADVVDHPRAGRRARTRPPAARMVSMLTSIPAAASVGDDRADPAQFLLVASTRCAPGRVDSPPTSTMSAPCVGQLAGRARPRRPGSSHRPPSENESGVTLTTPMTRQRPGRAGGGPARVRPRRRRHRVRLIWVIRRNSTGWFATARARGAERGGLTVRPSASLRANRRTSERRPDQERLGLQRGQADPGRVPGAGEDQEPGLPLRAELRVELVQRLDLEPPGQEEQDAAPGAQHRPGPDPLAALQRGPEHGEVQRDALHAEVGRRLDGLDDQEVVQARLGGPVPAHQVEREPVVAPRHEVQERPELAVLGGGGDHAALVAGGRRSGRAPSRSRARSGSRARSRPA